MEWSYETNLKNLREHDLFVRCIVSQNYCYGAIVRVKASNHKKQFLFKFI